MLYYANAGVGTQACVYLFVSEAIYHSYRPIVCLGRLARENEATICIIWQIMGALLDMQSWFAISVYSDKLLRYYRFTLTPNSVFACSLSLISICVGFYYPLISCPIRMWNIKKISNNYTGLKKKSKLLPTSPITIFFLGKRAF